MEIPTKYGRVHLKDDWEDIHGNDRHSEEYLYREKIAKRVANLTPEQLERKRARNRKAKAAERARKGHW